MEAKVCSCCKVEKPVSEFSKNKTRKDGYQDQCKECNKAPHKAWRDANSDRHNANKAKYRATKIKATPLWADLKQIREFYEIALAFRMYTGLEYHVDHIVPLKGKTVCGLHCEDNLQVLEASENISKNNRYWPDMPT